MKRRDFLKIGVSTAFIGTVAAKQAAGQMTTATTHDTVVQPLPWSAKFRSVTAHITQDTYDAFFLDPLRNQSAEAFLDYLFSGVVTQNWKMKGGFMHR